jgi:hypothetical protein
MAIALIIGFFILFIQGWIVWYLAYFKKKGEYDAIKEDIGQVTTLTESIKNDLNLLTQKEINLDVLKRNSILEYFDSLELAIHDLLFKIRIYDQKTLDEYHTTTFTKYLVAYGRFKLFIRDEQILNIVQETHNNLELMIISQENSASFSQANGNCSESDIKEATNVVLEEESERLSEAYNKLIVCQEKLRDEIRKVF